jgi:hypothetical protein
VQAVSNYDLRACRLSNLGVVLRLSRKDQHAVSQLVPTMEAPHGSCHRIVETAL